MERTQTHTDDTVHADDRAGQVGSAMARRNQRMQGCMIPPSMQQCAARDSRVRRMGTHGACVAHLQTQAQRLLAVAEGRRPLAGGSVRPACAAGMPSSAASSCRPSSAASSCRGSRSQQHPARVIEWAHDWVHPDHQARIGQACMEVRVGLGRSGAHGDAWRVHGVRRPPPDAGAATAAEGRRLLAGSLRPACVAGTPWSGG
jgi:hypothetical protein